MNCFQRSCWLEVARSLLKVSSSIYNRKPGGESSPSPAGSWLLNLLSFSHLRARALPPLYKQRCSVGGKDSQAGTPGPAASASPGIC